MSGTQIAIDRIADGRIVEIWAEWDDLAGLRMLGFDDASGGAATRWRDDSDPR